MKNDSHNDWDAQEASVKAAMRDPGDASILHIHPGSGRPEFPADYAAQDRQPGDMPVLNPGAYGGIGEFKAECDAWGFNAAVEGPLRCDEQFDMTGQMATGINMAMLACHSASVYAGWWYDKDTGAVLSQPYQIAIKLCLIHSEVSEAMEGDRKQLMDDKLPHRPMFEVELADVFIRLMDLAGATQCDLAGAVVEKMAFNASRADHKVENRKGAKGKAY